MTRRFFAYFEVSVARFMTAGVLNTFIGLCVIYSSKLGGMSDIAANLLGYGVGLAVSFTLNSRWTFRFHGSQAWALLRFVLVVVVAYSANLATVLSLIEFQLLDSYLAQAAGILPYVLVAYLGSRHFAFRVDQEQHAELRVANRAQDQD